MPMFSIRWASSINTIFEQPIMVSISFVFELVSCVLTQWVVSIQKRKSLLLKTFLSKVVLPTCRELVKIIALPLNNFSKAFSRLCVLSYPDIRLPYSLKARIFGESITSRRSGVGRRTHNGLNLLLPIHKIIGRIGIIIQRSMFYPFICKYE